MKWKRDRNYEAFSAVMVELDAEALRVYAGKAGAWAHVAADRMDDARWYLANHTEVTCATVTFGDKYGIRFLDGAHRTLALLETGAKIVVLATSDAGARKMVEELGGKIVRDAE